MQVNYSSWIHFSKYFIQLLNFQESNEKASIICPESTIRALGPWDGATPLQLSAQINKINHRLKRENEKCLSFCAL